MKKECYFSNGVKAIVTFLSNLEYLFYLTKSNAYQHSKRTCIFSIYDIASNNNSFLGVNQIGRLCQYLDANAVRIGVIL